MNYFSEEVDAHLATLITRALAREYFERVEDATVVLAPLTAYQLKGDKLDLPACAAEDIGSTTAGGFPYAGNIITNAGVS